MNVASLIQYARDLSGVYSSDVVPDSLITRWINESYFGIYRQGDWPWGPPTELVTGTDIPAFDDQFHAVLAYSAAIAILGFSSDDTKRAELYSGQVQSFVTDMRVFYFPSAATGSSNTLTTLVRLVRDLIGSYDNKAVTSDLIKVHINRAYNELANMHDWDWLERSYSGEMPTPSAGVHTVMLTNGTRRVLDAVAVMKNGEVREMVQTPNLDLIEENASGIYYDVTVAGVLKMKPVQYNVEEVKFRYTQANVNLTDSTGPLFLPQFNTMLAYRAAASLMMVMAPNDPRIATFMAEYQSMYEGMWKLYELDHDDRTFQMGQDGIETRRFYPWFRPA